MSVLLRVCVGAFYFGSRIPAYELGINGSDGVAGKATLGAVAGRAPVVADTVDLPANSLTHE
jgi:hypothetical protein